LSDFPFPNPKPFDGVLVEQLRNPYRSSINPAELISKAMTDLRLAEPEAFKIFLLSLMAGLRRNEVDKLQWSSIDWHRNTITVELHETFSGKNRASEATVPVDPRVLKMLAGFKPSDGAGFVIQSKVQPKPDAISYSHYRANRHFQTLIQWLRANRVAGHCPIHTLRKECGRMVTESRGIYAASKQLRHRDITTTARYYADDRRATFPELPELVETAEPSPARLQLPPPDSKPDSETDNVGEAALPSPTVSGSVGAGVAA
jgi:integrase